MICKGEYLCLDSKKVAELRMRSAFSGASSFWDLGSWEDFYSSSPNAFGDIIEEERNVK